MASDLKKRIKKVGQLPGTLVYTGANTNLESKVTVLSYNQNSWSESADNKFTLNLLKEQKKNSITWVHVEGLCNIELIEAVTKHYSLHPLTVEDILSVAQRSKIEEFSDYIFITMKVLLCDEELDKEDFEQLSIIIGQNFVLSFLERDIPIFESIRNRIKSNNNQAFLSHGSDYLAYRLMDSTIDQYFLVIEKLNDRIENLEGSSFLKPSNNNAHELYHLKHKLLLLHKSVWPTREAISHLLQIDHKFINPAIRLYYRDIYDHVVQAIEIIENLRDILSSILEVYLSLVTNRLNEVMKVLTIMSTLFIPATFITSLYGMNFKYMPELNWRFGYPIVLVAISVIFSCMLIYFRRKKWL